MAISEDFSPIYNEFCARKSVIRCDASEELDPFEVSGDMAGFVKATKRFDNGEKDAAQAIEELTKLLEKYYGTEYSLSREMRGPSFGRW
jgi:hypothetical protein